MKILQRCREADAAFARLKLLQRHGQQGIRLDCAAY
jgi:hypothetical protein